MSAYQLSQYYKPLLELVGVLFGGYFAPTVYIGSLWKSKRSKRYKMTQRKEHSKQSCTNKNKFIYQQIYKQWNITKHYEYSNIVC